MSRFIDLLRSRRSIRAFSPEPISDEQLSLLKEALLRAPTSRGRNPWLFYFVTDPARLEQLSAAKEHGSAFLAGAKLAVVVCADETISDVWIEDCSIAAISLQYVAHELGLGSCWAQIRERMHGGETTAEQHVQQLLELPPHVRVASIIGIGHPAEQKAGHPFDALPHSRLESKD